MNPKNLELLFFLLLAVLIGCDGKKNNTVVDQVSVRLKWVHQAQFAGFYVAEKKGFYAAENIDASINPRQSTLSNDEIVADLINQKTHFAIMGGDSLLTQRSKGAPIVGVAVIFQRNPYAYATLQSSGILRPKDIIGKKLMLPDESKLQHEALMKRLGVSYSDFKIVPYDRKSKALREGEIDAVLVYRTGTGLRLEKESLDLNFIWLADYGIRLYADTIVTSEKMIQNNPDLVKRFLRASLKGWRYAIENPEQAVAKTLATDSTLDKKEQTRMMHIQTPLIHTGEDKIGWMKPAVWQEMQKILKLPDEKGIVDSAYTMAFLYQIFGKEE